MTHYFVSYDVAEDDAAEAKKALNKAGWTEWVPDHTASSGACHTRR